jgi:hypothetical protein
VGQLGQVILALVGPLHAPLLLSHLLGFQLSLGGGRACSQVGVELEGQAVGWEVEWTREES